MEGLKKLYLAVDIGGTSVKIGLVDEDGNFRGAKKLEKGKDYNLSYRNNKAVNNGTKSWRRWSKAAAAF